jgi:hypothetical protein
LEHLIEAVREARMDAAINDCLEKGCNLTAMASRHAAALLEEKSTNYSI